MAGEFEKRLSRGQVTKGAFTTGPDDPHETIEHAGYYNDKNGVIHIEPFVFDSVRVDNPVTKRRFMQALVMVSLHESAHALGYEHPRLAIRANGVRCTMIIH